MSQSLQVSFFASPDFTQAPNGTLICESLSNRPDEAARLGEDSILLLVHPEGQAPEIAGKCLVDEIPIPAGVPSEITTGHGIHSLALLDFAVEVEWDFLWFVHRDVHYAGDWAEFFASFEDSRADFLAPHVRNRRADPGWLWWKNLYCPPGAMMPPIGTQVAALSLIFRISRRAFEEVRAAVQAGWRGHCEAIFPTAIAAAGLTVEDLGADGKYTPEARKGLHYSGATFSAHRAPDQVPGFLHYPVSPPAMDPSPQRFRPASPDIPKILYFSPIGKAASGLLRDTIARFKEASAEILLVEYEPSGAGIPEGCNVLQDQGQKWELVRKHLNPDRIKEFDYVFVWDDDIGIADFDPLRFVKIMESNRLAMAQPSLLSPHPLCHGITRQEPCPADLGKLSRVGRLTNFVEIMVPVFTRESWREFYSYLTPATRLGGGFDSLPLGRKGIVDCMYVVHTRPWNQYGSAARQEMSDFLSSQALFECHHQTLGHLLEAPRTQP